VKLYDLKSLVFRRNARFELQIEEFTLERGEKVALVGQNGSGKTTFLRLLSFLEKPSSWTLFHYKGRPYSGSVDRGGMGFLKQQPYLFRGTVAHNLVYPLKLRRLPSQEVGRRVEAMLAMTELGRLATAHSRDLSGGEQKRLALGRVLIAEPELLLLDEPTAHLDVQSRTVVENVLKKTEMTLLLTTHDLHFALRVSDRVLNMRGGRVFPSLPENLVLSHERLSSSMRNQFRGRVASVRERGSDVWLKIDCGERLTAIITRAAYEEMGVNLHSDVVVSFGVNAVEVL